jgi:hypothetical protein
VTARGGPPDRRVEVVPAAKPGPATTNLTNASRHPSNQRTSDYTVPPRHICSHSRASREGFGYGFRDALRLAGRRLPPDTWATLDRLADDYELTTSDG